MSNRLTLDIERKVEVRTRETTRCDRKTSKDLCDLTRVRGIEPYEEGVEDYPSGKWSKPREEESPERTGGTDVVIVPYTSRMIHGP